MWPQKTKVVLLTILAACLYGVIHDQVTVRLCLEYFTVGHPPLFPTTSPTLLALCWGIAATAGVGAGLGAVLALVSQSGVSAPCSIRSLARRMLPIFGTMALAAFLAAWVGHQLSQAGLVRMPEALAGDVPASRHDRFMAAWFAHGASYLVGLGGGGRLCYRVWKERGRPHVLEIYPRTLGAALRAAAIIAVASVLLWFRFRS